MKILLESDTLENVSPTFSGPATLTGFGFTPTRWVPETGVVQEVICGDRVRFERVLTDAAYDVTCGKVGEKGVQLSAPVMTKCGCPVEVNAVTNTYTIEGKGLYRAIYTGQNRANITLIME